MSFANLMRKSPSATPDNSNAVSVDEFIHQADDYANGRQPKLVAVPEVVDAQSAMGTASFRLTEDAKATLAHLSEMSGISRSRLIRIWLDEVEPAQAALHYQRSRVR